MRVVLKISYDGTNYCGWQRQKNGVSVQEVLEDVLLKLTGEKTNLTASGRTDSGVHAAGQIAHFDTNATIPPEKFYLALNSLLPNDVRVLSSFLAPDGFHARYTAKRKTYLYNFYISQVALPLKERYAVKIDDFDVEKANAALQKIVGTHDFKCFLSSGSEIKTTVRTIYSLTIDKTDNDVCIEVCGNGFLYNMVRIIAGTALMASQGKISATDVDNALLTGNRTLVGKTAPAKGLTLKSVEY